MQGFTSYLSFIFSIFIFITITLLPKSDCELTSEPFVAIRIVEGIDKKSDLATADDYVQPGYPSGPKSLYFLNGMCFDKSVDRFEYSICPFQNVTQKRIGSVRPLLLGVWGHWDMSSSSSQFSSTRNFSTMKYSDGQPCALKEKSATVTLQCLEESDYFDQRDFEITDVDDTTHSCDYFFTLHIPFPCSILQEEIPNTPVVNRLDADAITIPVHGDTTSNRDSSSMATIVEVIPAATNNNASSSNSVADGTSLANSSGRTSSGSKDSTIQSMVDSNRMITEKRGPGSESSVSSGVALTEAIRDIKRKVTVYY